MATITETDFCVIDTETTGGSAAYDRIIDVAVFHVRDGIVLDKFQTLINPGKPIPGWITMLTGISDEMVRNAPRFDEIAGALRDFLDRGVFVAHNAGFDFGFVQGEFARLGDPWTGPKLCTVRLARLLFPELASRSLGNLCEHLMIDIYDRHRASGDAEATVYVLKHLLKMAKEHGVSSWEDLEMFAMLGPLALPPGFDHQFLATVPEVPGRLVFKDGGGSSIFKGKTKNLRRRLQAFFKLSNQSPKSNRFRELVRHIDVLLDGSPATLTNSN